MSGRHQKPLPVGFIAERPSRVKVIAHVKRVDDEARARRLAELLADLIDAPAPDEGP